MDLILTKEEKEFYDTLPEHQKESWKIKNFKEKQVLMSECTVHMTRLIEIFDEMEKKGLSKSKIKIALRPAKIQIEAYLNRTFKVNDDPTKGNSLINTTLTAMRKAIDDVMKEFKEVVS